MSAKDWIEKDYYAVLGVPKDADADTIKKAYRKLAKKYHPDANTSDAAAEARFKEVGEAYEVLGDEAKRREYDEMRRLGYQFPGAGGAGGGFGGGGAGGVNLDDLLSRMGQGGGGGQAGGAGGFGGFGDVLGGLFNRGGRTQGPRRGSDVDSEVTLSFDEALAGVTLPLRLSGEGPCASCRGTGARAGTTPRVCPSCNGTGSHSRNAGGFAFAEPCRECGGRGLVVDDPCPDCHGSGRALTSRTVQARIPAGVKDGARIRLKGKGTPGEHGGPHGDLYITVHVTAHPVFGRKDDNLTVEVPITIDEAALGAKVTVPVPDGPSVTLKIPSGTQNGRTFRVRGKGATRKDGTRGDLLVTVAVAVPLNLSTAAKEALEAYQHATTDHDPRAELHARAAKAAAGKAAAGAAPTGGSR